MKKKEFKKIVGKYQEQSDFSTEDVDKELWSFIEKWDAKQRDEIVIDVIRKFATGEFVKTELAEKFEREIRKKQKEEIREDIQSVKSMLGMMENEVDRKKIENFIDEYLFK